MGKTFYKQIEKHVNLWETLEREQNNISTSFYNNPNFSSTYDQNIPIQTTASTKDDINDSSTEKLFLSVKDV